MRAAANAAGSAAPGIAPAATLSVTHAEITMPTAATKSGREARDATNPPSSIPPAEPPMYAATALDARVAAMPNCSFIAATPKLIRPVSAAACSKNRKRATARPESSTRASRSEEHTSELQSRLHLVCRLLLEKKKKQKDTRAYLA